MKRKRERALCDTFRNRKVARLIIELRLEIRLQMNRREISPAWNAAILQLIDHFGPIDRLVETYRHDEPAQPRRRFLLLQYRRAAHASQMLAIDRGNFFAAAQRFLDARHLRPPKARAHLVEPIIEAEPIVA